MNKSASRKARLEELIELAQAYRGWSRTDVARALRRDASKLIPESGVPKLDFVVHLADALDWPTDHVIETWSMTERVAREGDDFEALNASAFEAYQCGRFRDMVELGRRCYAAATCAEDRMRACNREAGGWQGLGRYRESIECVRRGLREHGVTVEDRLLLHGNLANIHYELHEPIEARGMATDIIACLGGREPTSLRGRLACAIAHYVRGGVLRRMIDVPGVDRLAVARQAKEDLVRAEADYARLADATALAVYHEISLSCRGGALEAQAFLGEIDADSVLAEFVGELEVTVVDSGLVGDALERRGWWCEYGCNVAMRHLANPHEQHRALAILTNKMHEIASRLGNWALWERVVSIDFARHAASGVDPREWTIDQEDVRVIAGTMGRFPHLFRTGWQILHNAVIVGNADA